MPTFLDGQYNLAALTVPNVYVDVIPPSPFLAGVPTNIVGLVGVASWGPTNAVILASKPNDAAFALGVPLSRGALGYKYDIASYIWASSQVGGAIGYNCIRVTDGTDIAASAVIQSTCITITAKYTGVLGNAIQFNIVSGTLANSSMLIVSMPGRAPEQFNNIVGAGNAFWVAAAAAINNGNSQRGPSMIVTASAGAGVAAPVLGTPVTLTGGTDGATGVTDATLVGQDTTPRKGMYALRSSGARAFTCCDLSDSTKYAIIDSLALSENMLAVHGTVSGDTITTAAATRVTAGIDSFSSWLIVGDYPTFYDNQNQISRLINPSAFGLGIVGNQSPEQSPLNKVLRGISATQRSQTGQTYSNQELSAAELGGIDIIIGPPTTWGGNYFTFATGRNTSSNTAAQGIEYSTMINFLAATAQSTAVGALVGQLQSTKPNDPTRAKAKALFDGLSAQLAAPESGSSGQGMIDSWAVQCDLNNNPPSLQARGYLFIYWTVAFLNVIRYIVVKLAGGPAGIVTVTVQSTPPTPASIL